jgi:hypothetical protein
MSKVSRQFAGGGCNSLDHTSDMFSKDTSPPAFPYLTQERSRPAKLLYKEKKIKRTESFSYVSCGKCYSGSQKLAVAQRSWLRTSGL